MKERLLRIANISLGAFLVVMTMGSVASRADHTVVIDGPIYLGDVVVGLLCLFTIFIFLDLLFKTFGEKALPVLGLIVGLTCAYLGYVSRPDYRMNMVVIACQSVPVIPHKVLSEMREEIGKERTEWYVEEIEARRKMTQSKLEYMRLMSRRNEAAEKNLGRWSWIASVLSPAGYLAALSAFLTLNSLFTIHMQLQDRS